MAPLASELVAGACFGAALLYSGLYTPMIITSQMRLQNNHMFETYLIASSLSTILVSTANAIGFLPVNIRTPKTVGFIAFDANIIGGALQGFGMAITASCPATIFVQVALSMRGAISTLLGCILGGVVYVLLAPHLQGLPSQPSKGEDRGRSQAHTLYDLLGLRQFAGALILTSLSIAVYYAFDPWSFKTGPQFESPILLGFFVALAQAITMLLVRRTVGVSTSFEDIGRALTTIDSKQPWKNLATSSTKFACGIIVGTLASVRLELIKVHPAAWNPSHPMPVPALVAGGAAMIFGARLAGGCTSGHGISGIATLSLSSFVTVAAMYAGGIVTSLLF